MLAIPGDFRYTKIGIIFGLPEGAEKEREYAEFTSKH